MPTQGASVLIKEKGGSSLTVELQNFRNSEERMDLDVMVILKERQQQK